MKRFVLLMAATVCACQLFAQNAERSVDFGMEYTTELQTNFKAVNWVNQLHLSFEWNICRAVSFNVGTFSVAKTREEGIINDLQGFSNIEADNLPLAWSVLGFQFNWSSGNVFAGVHNVNEDYFTSPHTSLFTGSSPGIFPTISEGLPIANYPYSALGVHLNQSIGNWAIQASIYNGSGYNGWQKGTHPFIINPKTDGVFAMASVDYENWESTYTLGGTVYYNAQTVAALWLNVEQRLTNYMHLLIQGSANISALINKDLPACKDYEGIGLIAHFNKAELGLIFNHATFAETHEFAAELTSQITLSPHLCLQPTLHLIRTGATTNCVALLRLCCELSTK